jgi:hypothetical protein
MMEIGDLLFLISQQKGNTVFPLCGGPILRVSSMARLLYDKENSDNVLGELL